MKKDELDEKLIDALLAYSNSEADKPPGKSEFNGNLTRHECAKLVEVIKLAIAKAGCQISEV